MSKIKRDYCVNFRSETRMGRCPSSVQGFTLMELLVVMAVIGVLAAIIIPALSAMRSTAQSSKCKGNLRNMQIANQLYASEHSNKYLAGIYFDEDKNVADAWLVNPEYFKMLSGLTYDRGWGEWDEDLLCPTTAAMGSPQWNILGANYGINYWLFYDQLDLPGWGQENSSWAIPVFLIENPGSTVAFADSTDWLLKTLDGYSSEDEKENGYNSAGYLAFRHRGEANAVHFDASVHSYTAEDMLDPNIRKRFTLR
ncbi:MAG: type II secretion system protein [Puniceicoccales bacterium]